LNGRQLQPSDVFTPNRFPVEEYNAYAAREEAEGKLERAMGRSQVPVVFGEFGVGKTTLAKRFFRTEDQEGRFVHVLTPAGKNLDDVAKIVLEKLDYAVEVGGEARTVRSTEGGLDIGAFAPLRARFAGRREQHDVRRTEFVVTTPTDQGLLELMADEQVVMALDEMHKASDGFRQQLAELIKGASNLGRGYPRIIVLGTTLDASRLVERDEGVDRLITEIRVRPMTDQEAETVVREGMNTLNIDISDDRVDRVVRTAAGAPALLQEICLDVAERSDAEGRRPVTDEDIDEAIRQFVLDSRARLTRKYMGAIETMGPRRYRKQILRAMAESPSDYVTMDELTTRISQNLGEDIPSTALSGPLRELKQVAYGQILTDIDRPGDAGRVYNMNTFNDPRMKAFIRVMNQVEGQGLLPSDEEVAALPEGEEEEEEEE
jgi:type II secretory pathway predicted ATPase ExeA